MFVNFIFLPQIYNASERRVELIAESKNNRDHFWTPVSVNMFTFFRSNQLKILNKNVKTKFHDPNLCYCFHIFYVFSLKLGIGFREG